MRSLRGRVALVAVVVVAIGFALTGAIVLRAATQQARSQLDADLRDRLSVLITATTTGVLRGPGAVDGRPGDGRPGPGQPDRDAPAPQPDDSTDAELADSDLPEGRVAARVAAVLGEVAERQLGPGFFLVVRTPIDGGVGPSYGDYPSQDPPAGTDRQVVEYTDADGGRWRVLTADLGGGRFGQIQIGADLDMFVLDDARALGRLLLLVGGTATVLTGLATAAATATAARPLQRLGQATRTVAETRDLSTRVPADDLPTEIAEVAQGLNTMLERLEAGHEAQAAALHGAQRFAADAGHELRTPLTSMQADLEALVRNPDAPPAVRQEALAEVSSEVRRLSTLLASLQALARADAGGAPDQGPVDLVDLAAQAAQATASRLPGLTVTGPPAEQGPVVVRGSEAWLRSVVDNLLTNAAVHGRPDGTVTIEVQPVTGGVLVVVDDDGPGIPADRRQDVFSRFVRGADADDRPGSGLGLSLVAQLVALHGGTVQVEDSPLGGARVVVRLPAQ